MSSTPDPNVTDLSNVNASLSSDVKTALTTIATAIDAAAQATGNLANQGAVARQCFNELVARLNETV